MSAEASFPDHNMGVTVSGPWKHPVGVQALEELQREGEAVKESYRCRICLSNDVDAVMTQCGHALCWTCASGCNDRCPFCRTPSFSIRMYR